MFHSDAVGDIYIIYFFLRLLPLGVAGWMLFSFSDKVNNWLNMDDTTAVYSAVSVDEAKLGPQIINL